MKRTILLSLFTFIVFLSYAQEIKDVYRSGNQETTIIRDKKTTDQEILGQLNIDGYSVGEHVKITQEMREEIRLAEERRARIDAAFAEQEASKNNPTASADVSVAVENLPKPTKTVSNKANRVTIRKKPVRKPIPEQEETIEEAAKPSVQKRIPTGKSATRVSVSSSSSGKVYKHKKSFKLFKSGNKGGGGSRKGKKAQCYKF